MKFRNLAAATATLSLLAAPVVVQAQQQSSDMRDDDDDGFGASWILGILAFAAIIAAIIIALKDDNDPVSP